MRGQYLWTKRHDQAPTLPTSKAHAKRRHSTYCFIGVLKIGRFFSPQTIAKRYYKISVTDFSLLTLAKIEKILSLYH